MDPMEVSGVADVSADISGQLSDGDDMSPPKNALFSRESSENMPTKEVRPMRKAKRTFKSPNGQSPNENGNGGGVSAGRVGTMFGCVKNGRRSRQRNARNRGQAKKGGAGGKGVWGKLGSELEENGVCQDANDPNYDSESQDEYKLEEVDPVLTEDQLDKTVKPILEEYLENGNTTEVEDLLNDLNLGPHKPKVVKMAITLALDRHNPQREMISRLISDLYGGVLSRDDIGRSFNDLLAGIDDLLLDTPDTPNLLGQFIARCIADDCLPPKFIAGYKGRVDSQPVKSALEKADVLLSMNHGMAHLDNIWGVGGGNRPVICLSNKMVDLLKEYVNSGDVKEAMRCLLELEVPHFHHELVYQACDLAIEDSTDRVRDMVAQLLKFLTNAAVITIDQFNKGMIRMYNDIHDINIDVPEAYHLLEQLVIKLQADGMISEELMRELPNRGRKRFVSEGDGGKLKPGLL